MSTSNGVAKKLVRIRKPGDLRATTRVLWQSIVTTRDMLLKPEIDDAVRLKAAVVLGQNIGQYLKCLEMSEAPAVEDLKDEIENLKEMGIAA